MKRRSALRGMIAAGLFTVQPLQALAQASAEKLQLISAALDIKGRFAKALKRHPMLRGYASVEQADFHTPKLKQRGNWPKDLKGSLYRNGPARHEIGDFRYQHWFDGDGMLQVFHLGRGNREIEHRARMIRTKKYIAEERAGRALYSGFGTHPPDAVGISGPDELNVANISVLAHHSKLFALWEAGSPYEMDKDDLSTIGEHEFSAPTSGVPFSAHPRVEPDGTLWNFGYASSLNKLVLWHLNSAGKIVKTGLVECNPISMVHDFVVTERHLVIMVCPLHYNPEKATNTFLDAHDWHPDRSTQVLVIDKNDFSKVQRLELPSQWLFHFSNAWEDSAGVIHFEAARAADPSVLDSTFKDIMHGKITPSTPSHMYSYRVETRTGKVTEAPLRADGDYEFPVVSPHLIGRQHTQLLTMSEERSVYPGLNRVSVFDLAKETDQHYRYPDHLIPEEHLLVGTPDHRGQLPWVIGTALNYKKSRTELFLYNAQALASGPIAQAKLPYALPLGLHGKFVTA